MKQQQRVSKSVWVRVRVRVKLPRAPKLAPLPRKGFTANQVATAAYWAGVLRCICKLMADGLTLNAAALRVGYSVSTVSRQRDKLINAELWPLTGRGRLGKRLMAALRPKLSPGRPKNPKRSTIA